MSQQSQTEHLESQQTEFKQGLWFALAAYGLWGLTPVYFKQLEGITPFEVLTHRVLWSVVFVSILVVFSRKLPAVIAIIRQPKLLLGLICTAGIISINWLTFIWAIGEHRILETSLGYFMNPLVSIFLGMIFLSERLRPLQWLALSLAGLGVAYQLILHGSLPWVALVLAFSFGFYGLLRKKIPVDAISGLLIETVIMLPAALIYLFWLAKAGELGFTHISLRIDLLLVAAGLVTSLPLLFFAASAKRLSLTMIGFMQYLAPSITFALAVTLYGETLDSSKLITFSLIWLALILFSLEGFWFQKKNRFA